MWLFFLVSVFVWLWAKIVHSFHYRQFKFRRIFLGIGVFRRVVGRWSEETVSECMTYWYKPLVWNVIVVCSLSFSLLGLFANLLSSVSFLYQSREICSVLTTLAFGLCKPALSSRSRKKNYQLTMITFLFFIIKRDRSVYLWNDGVI